jgi:cyclomaltodextrinase / maltogenic alpha-amylase / neopullulanase
MRSLYALCMTLPILLSAAACMACFTGTQMVPASQQPPATAPAAAATREPALTHDPRLAEHVTPISAGLGLIDLSVSAAPDVTAVDVIIIGQDGNRRRVPMSRDTRGDNTTWSTRLKLGSDIRGTYHFAAANFETERFPLVIAPKFETPDWAKGAVWYQIFPERFKNAVAANDPNGSGVFMAPWTTDWYKVLPGELEAWEKRRAMNPDTRQRGGGDLHKVIFDRRYGGDLQGVQQKMGELADLGITAIYLNPIFQARSLHKYDASDFRHIDEALGNTTTPSQPIDAGYYRPPAGETEDPSTWTWTQADRYFVDEFLPAAKSSKLRVVLDGVWNHVGFEHWAFADLKKRGKASPYAPWFIAEFGSDGKLESWSGWERKNGYLPEFRQVLGEGRDWDKTVEKGDLNAGAKKHVFDVTRRWMDPDGDGNPRDGIDGWRLDVAGEVGDRFWKSWREHVRTINPEAITIAEIWSKAKGLTDANIFDTQMHYPFAYPVLAWLNNAELERPKPNADGKLATTPVTSAQLAARLEEAFASDPAQTQLVHQNLFASHDTDRYVNMLWNPGRGYNQDNRLQNRDEQPRERDDTYVPYNAGRPPREVYQRSLLGVAIQSTYIGAPMIFYGDEYGMWGANDPTCRKPLPWEDTGANEDARMKPDADLRTRYRAWLRLRQDPQIGDTLRFGSVRHLESGSADVFAFERELMGQRVVIVINRGTSEFNAAKMLEQEWGTAASDAAVGPINARWFVR